MLDHVEIHVSDFERSRAFYLRALAAMGQVPRKTLATGMGFGVDAPDDASGRDNGGPGVRPQYHPHYYGAFILDPDGYNIEAVCHRAETGS